MKAEGQAEHRRLIVGGRMRTFAPPNFTSTPADAQRTSFVLLAILTAIAILWVMYVAQSLLFPITLALILSLVLSPVVRQMHQLHIPRPVGAALVLVGLFMVIGIAVTSLLAPATTWIQEAPTNLRAIERKMHSLRMSIAPIEQASKRVDEMARGEDEDAVPVAVRSPGMAITLLTSTRGIVAGAFFAVVLLYFLLATGDRFVLKLVELMPTWHDKRRVVEVVRQMQRNMSTYLCTVTVINVCLGVVIGAGMWLLGMPNPVLWGVMGGCLNFIPYAGAVGGATVVFLVALLSFDTVGQAVLAPLIYAGANTLEAYFVTPTLLGRSVKLNPVAILLFLAIFAWLWGVGGALLAVPLLATAKIFFEHFEGLTPMAKFLTQ